MNLSEIGKPRGTTHKPKRVGRGDGSGLGKTSGRGHKGQNSRSGGGVRPGFEGGQMPLIRRIPKRGFTNIFRTPFSIVNVDALNVFDEKEPVNAEALMAKGLVKSLKSKIKILGEGELKKKLTVNAHAFSKVAKEKIENAGGKVEIL